MASVSGSYTYADGEGVNFCVDIDDSFPSSLWEAKAICIEAIRELTGIPAADVAFDFDNED
jgi:hypothetical protein